MNKIYTRLFFIVFSFNLCIKYKFACTCFEGITKYLINILCKYSTAILAVFYQNFWYFFVKMKKLML